MSKTTRWSVRAAGLLLPLLCAAGASAMPGGGDYCTEEQVRRIVWSADYVGEDTTTCHYSCTVTDETRWICWGWEPDPLPYLATAPDLEPDLGSGLESFTAGAGPEMCGLVPKSTGDASDTYTVPKDKPKGGEQYCPPPPPSICCEWWNGACLAGQ